MSIILASASPRRQELLTQVGCDFEVITSSVIEDNTQDLPPNELAVVQAKAKAADVAGKLNSGDIVIGADTIVVLDGQVFGKPADAYDACRMLSDLSGREHQVVTGVAIVECGTGRSWTDFSVTTVHIAQLTKEEIERYVATGEPMDKAGAYAIQGVGALFVERINGCYTNVVGLPLATLRNLLNMAGVYLL